MMPPRSTVSCLELPLRDPHYPDLADVLDYWEAKRAGRLAPSRADIEPLDLVPILPRIMLVDVIPPLAFRYRLSGTGIADIHGIELTGLSPRDLRPVEYGQLIDQHYRICVAERRPLLHLILLDLEDRSRAYARLLLPLSNDHETVGMLMSVDSQNQNVQNLKEYFAGHTND